MMDKSTKVTIGLAMTVCGMLAVTLWQAHGISQSLEVRNTVLSGEIAVLGAKVDALNDRVQYVTDGLKERLQGLEAQVQEIAKRNP